MKALFIGGTGTISTHLTHLVAQNEGWELTLLNRGNRNANIPGNVRFLKGDINDEPAAAALLDGLDFDVVIDFIGFRPEQVERDIRLFRDKTRQFIYISSAAAYLTPPANHVITEGVLQCNPYWQYARNKIACEALLLDALRQTGFPVTIVRPSHTYSERSLPLGLDSAKGGCWPVMDRMLKGKPVIIPGDGSSLWTATFSSDVAKGIFGLMGNLHAIGEAVHITTDESLTWDQIHAAVADILGVPKNFYHIATDFLVAANPELDGPMNGDKRHSVFFDNTKIKQLVPGYCATVRFDQGARISVEYILSHPERQIADPDFDKWCDDVIAVMDKAKEQLTTLH